MGQGLIVYAVILLIALITIVLSARARNIQLRRITAYGVIPATVGEAVESDKAVHMSFGSSAVREESTLSAIASADILYALVERASLSDRSPIITLSDPVTLALGQDTLRRAYKARDFLRKYRPTMARWYPQGPLSMAFAAGVSTAIADEGVSTNVLVGRFGPELMLIAESAVRRDSTIVAQSDQINGQAVAYAVSDSPLIGEELYVGGAYLGRTNAAVASTVAQDVVRYLVIALIIGLFILAVVGVTF